ncbi:MAG: hypothetical protein Q8S01_00975, partial [Ignavibacteria bacterium]|nr:hypothetical protein [Ignavibacteria bacterium]
NSSIISLGFLKLRRTTKAGVYPRRFQRGASTSFVFAQSILLNPSSWFFPVFGRIFGLFLKYI